MNTHLPLRAEGDLATKEGHYFNALGGEPARGIGYTSSATPGVRRIYNHFSCCALKGFQEFLPEMNFEFYTRSMAFGHFKKKWVHLMGDTEEDKSTN